MSVHRVSGAAAVGLQRQERCRECKASLAFANHGQRKYKCPNRLSQLMRLIDGHPVPAIANNLDVCSRNHGEHLTPVLLQRILPVLVIRQDQRRHGDPSHYSWIW